MKAEKPSEHGHPCGTIYNPACDQSPDYVVEKFLLTCLCVAGKKAETQQKKVDLFMKEWCPLGCERVFRVTTPHEEAAFLMALKKVRMGTYAKLVSAAKWISSQERDFMYRCTRRDLVKCPGIGYKTASFFLLYSRDDYPCAVLDVHVLRWLRGEGGYPAAPQSTPTNASSYMLWERCAIYALYDEYSASENVPKDIMVGTRKLTDILRRADFDVWSKRAGVS